jgi:hypothetical protein
MQTPNSTAILRVWAYHVSGGSQGNVKMEVLKAGEISEGIKQCRDHSEWNVNGKRAQVRSSELNDPMQVVAVNVVT